MEAKLRQLMKHEGINSTRLAEILGIQASGISHIMSGRNKPSFDFLLKLLGRFPQINPDWLILDRGPMYRDGIKSKGAQNPPAGAHSGPGAPGGFGGPSVSGGGGAPGGFGGPSVSGGGGAPGGFGAPYNVGGDVARAGNTGTSGELFGPDNNDIIPSGRPSAGQIVAHPAERASVSSAERTSGNPVGHPASGLPGALHSGLPTGGHAGGFHGVGQGGQGGVAPVSQTVGFSRAALIERIVVFYKDKTFSEYQPE